VLPWNVDHAILQECPFRCDTFTEAKRPASVLWGGSCAKSWSPPLCPLPAYNSIHDTRCSFEQHIAIAFTEELQRLMRDDDFSRSMAHERRQAKLEGRIQESLRSRCLRYCCSRRMFLMSRTRPQSKQRRSCWGFYEKKFIFSTGRLFQASYTRVRDGR